MVGTVLSQKPRRLQRFRNETDIVNKKRRNTRQHGVAQMRPKSSHESAVPTSDNRRI